MRPRSTSARSESENPERGVDELWIECGPAALRFATVLVGADDAHDVMANAFLRIGRTTGWSGVDEPRLLGRHDRGLHRMVVVDRIVEVTTSNGRRIRPVSNVRWDVTPLDAPVTYTLVTADGVVSQPITISAG